MAFFVLLIRLLLLVSSLVSFFTLCSALNSDGLSLLALKSAVESDPTRFLDSWSESDPSPCRWPGILCTHKRVNSVVLSNKQLSGYIPSELGLLDSLSRLDLSHNNFSRPIPSRLFSNANLRFLDLSHNFLTGSIPAQIGTLENLTHLDLSSNLLNGSLPDSLTNLTKLAGTLNLSYNRFSGEIPASYGRFPVFISLDLQHNNLTGKVPQVGSLLNQGPTAFVGNPSLCGFPLENPCTEAVNPSVVIPRNSEIPQNLQKPNPSFVDRTETKDKQKYGSVTVSLISGATVVIGAVSVSVWLIRRKWVSADSQKGKSKGEKVTQYDEERQDGKFVVVDDEGFDLELEDLLRASAYVVGKSRSGIVYKVVVGKGSSSTPAVGTAVAVRRLSEEDDATWCFKEFEAEMETISRIQHPNIVRLRAYYYSQDEKLLVTDFVRNGSLYSALHGGLGNAVSTLSWAERLRIAQGTARGLMSIHEHGPKKHVHGNLKPSKILLDDELQPYISGFGLARLVPAACKPTNSFSKKHNLNQTIITSTMASSISNPSNVYLAPEARVSVSKFTQKSDVYSFGIILLEIITGRLPNACPENDGEQLESLVRKRFKDERLLGEIVDPLIVKEVYAKKQVLAAFNIALNCTEMDPEMRPRMRSVSESLGRIKLE